MLVLGVSTLTRWERLSHRILEVNEHFKPFLSHVRINGQLTIWARPLLRHATSASTRGLASTWQGPIGETGRRAQQLQSDCEAAAAKAHSS